MIRLVWLTIALPVLGFVVNGILALTRTRSRALVSVVGAGVLLASFAVAVGVFLELRATPDAAPVVVSLWPWLHVADLRISVALQVDQLSTTLLLIVTGVGSLIHLF